MKYKGEITEEEMFKLFKPNAHDKVWWIHDSDHTPITPFARDILEVEYDDKDFVMELEHGYRLPNVFALFEYEGKTRYFLKKEDAEAALKEQNNQND